jgi:hypothetical protein
LTENSDLSPEDAMKEVRRFFIHLVRLSVCVPANAPEDEKRE